MSIFEEFGRNSIDMRTLAYAEAADQNDRQATVTGPDGVTKLWLRLNSSGALVMDPLKHERPNVALFTRIDILSNSQYRVNGGSVQSYGSTLTLPTSTDDYVVYLPAAVALGKLNGVTISGGRDVAVIGGEVNFSDILTPPYGFANYNQSARRGVQMLNFRRSLYVEGTWVHGNQLCDGWWTNPSVAQERKVIMQNCIVEGCAAEDLQAIADGIHPDVVQVIDKSNSVYAQTSFHFYQCMFRTAYQGLTTNDNVPLMELERVFFDMVSITNWDGTKQSGYPLGIFDSGTQGTHLRIGPEVEVKKDIARSGGPVFPESMPGWWDQITVDPDLPDPAWFGVIPPPGRGYTPPQQIQIVSGDLAAHIAATTSVHGIADTSKLVGGVVHGSNAAEPRPSGFSFVIWVGSVTPANATSNDVVVVG